MFGSQFLKELTFETLAVYYIIAVVKLIKEKGLEKLNTKNKIG